MEEIWRDLDQSPIGLCSGFIYDPSISGLDNVEGVLGCLDGKIEVDDVRGLRNLELFESKEGEEEEFGHGGGGVGGVDFEGVKTEESVVKKRAGNFCCVGSWIGSTRFRRSSSSSLGTSGARSQSVARPHGSCPTLLDSLVIVSDSQSSATTGTLVVSDADVNSAMVDSVRRGVKECDGHASFTYNPHETAVSLACFPGFENMVSPAYDMAQRVEAELSDYDMALLQPRDEYAFTEQFPIEDTAKNFNSYSPAEVSNNVAVNADSPAWRVHDPINTSGSEASPDDEPPTAEETPEGEIDLIVQKVASPLPVGILRTSNDGYNWRKYGQKQVKGSEYPRGYYKCTYLDCPVKKKIERSQDGQITEIIYKGDHNHPKPHPVRRSTSGSVLSLSESPEASVKADGNPKLRSIESQSKDMIVGTDWRAGSESVFLISGVAEVSKSIIATGGNLVGVLESAGTSPLSSTFASQEEGEDAAAERSMLRANDNDDEFDSKRRRKEGFFVESVSDSRDRREPRVVIQTESKMDILDDGYRWRKYGQKVVKGNPNPRSYYKCTSAGCTVRKHVERASQDLKYVLTAYEGKHNHEVPAARNSSHRSSAGESPPTALNTVVSFSCIGHFPKHEPQDLAPIFDPEMSYCNDFLRPYYSDSLRGSAALFHPMNFSTFPAAMPFGSFGSSPSTIIDQYARPMAPPFSNLLPFEFPSLSDLTFTGCSNHSVPVAGFQSFFAEQELKAHEMKYLTLKHETGVDSFCCAGVNKKEQMQ